MELIDDLNEELWSRGDPNETEDYKQYRLMKCEKLTPPGNFLYAIFDEDGFLHKVKLHGGAGSRDPLTGISLLQVRLSPEQDRILGIIVEDDCVLLKEAMPAENNVPNDTNADADTIESDSTIKDADTIESDSTIKDADTIESDSTIKDADTIESDPNIKDSPTETKSPSDSTEYNQETSKLPKINVINTPEEIILTCISKGRNSLTNGSYGYYRR